MCWRRSLAPAPEQKCPYGRTEALAAPVTLAPALYSDAIGLKGSLPQPISLRTLPCRLDCGKQTQSHEGSLASTFQTHQGIRRHEQEAQATLGTEHIRQQSFLDGFFEWMDSPEGERGSGSPA